jgi:hypothetical protein
LDGKELYRCDHLMWEVVPCGGNHLMLQITPADYVELQPLADTCVQHAPKIDGWEFAGYRQPIPWDVMPFMFSSRRDAELPPLTMHFIAINCPVTKKSSVT